MTAMKGFTRLPMTLYRIQARLPVNLRDFEIQHQKGRSSFDLKSVNGIVHPMPPNSSFHTPNGMSLRPVGENMLRILQEYKGEPRIYRIHEGLLLPSGLIVYHEHTDHWSLQTSEPIALAAFNEKLTAFLETLPSQTRQQFLEQLEDEEDQDN
jgi:hypothetical protein